MCLPPRRTGIKNEVKVPISLVPTDLDTIMLI